MSWLLMGRGRQFISWALKATLVAGFSVLGIVAIIPQSNVSAANCPSTRTSCNDAESEARYEDCNNDGSRRGSIWFSTSSGTNATNDEETGYYAQGVIVEGDDTSVTVKIRGSVWPCGSNRTGRVYAYHIKDNRANPKLTISGNKTLYRGNVTSSSTWSSQGGSVTGRLNVEGIANLNGQSSASEVIVIPLYRCFSSVISSVSCYATNINVRVTRIAEPTNVTLVKSTARYVSDGTNNNYTTVPSGLSWNTSNYWQPSDGEAVAGNDYVFFLNRVRATGTAGAEYSFERARQRKIEKIDDDDFDFVSQSYCPSGWVAAKNSCLSNSNPAGTRSTWTTAPHHAFYPVSNPVSRSWSTENSAPSKVTQSRAGTSICERYGTDPKTISGTAGWHWGGWRCVDMAYWSLGIETYIKVNSGSWLDDDVAIVRPGNKINFRHEISNSGNQTSTAVNGRTSTGSRTGSTWTAYANIGTISSEGTLVMNNTEITVAASDAGSTICSKYAVSQSTNKYFSSSLTAGRGYLESWGDAEVNQGAGSFLCASVPYNYNLTPTLNVGSTTLEAGTVTTLSGIGGSVRNETTNNGNASTNSKATDYTLRYFTTTDKQCIINNPTNYSLCSGRGPMVNLSSGAIGALAPNSSVTNGATGFTLPNSVGSVCFVLSVGRAQGEATITDNTVTNQTKNSPASCVTLGKKPKVAITGGDVIVGRRQAGSTITTTTTTYPKNATAPTSAAGDNTTTGSWGEYSAFASGTVSRFGTGAGFANRSNTTSAASLNVGLGNFTSACQHGVLTFTNLSMGTDTNGNVATPSCAGTQGGYMVQSVARPIVDLLKPTATTPQTAWTSTVEGETTIRSYTSSRAIQGQNIKGTVIISVDGDVTIDGNITLDEPTLKSAYGSGNFKNIPQVIIIASGNITINEGVTRVDAWLITQGASSIVRTCNKVGSKSTSDCSSQLIVNGPVVTNKLELLRTAGADVSAANDRGAKPAEMFNLRADAYLWARGYAMKNQSPARTTYVKELSPRL